MSSHLRLVRPAQPHDRSRWGQLCQHDSAEPVTQRPCTCLERLDEHTWWCKVLASVPDAEIAAAARLHGTIRTAVDAAYHPGKLSRARKDAIANGIWESLVSPEVRQLLGAQLSWPQRDVS